MTTINDLPNKILTNIFLYIDIVERQRLETVCKQWRSIIRHIWCTIRKIKFLEIDLFITRGEYIPDGIHLISERISDLEDLLKICGDNLMILEIHHTDARDFPDSTFELIRNHHNLRSLRVEGEIPTSTAVKYLKCFRPGQLHHLSLDNEWADEDESMEIEDAIKEILLNAGDQLTFLHLGNVTLPTLEIISNVSSLKSLHLGCMVGETIEMSTVKLINLESLTIGTMNLFDGWLIELAKNCQKLRAVHIYSDRGHVDITIGLKAIAKMPNLRYLNLMNCYHISNEVLNSLSNLEELYGDFQNTITTNELSEFLQRSPKFKIYGPGLYDCTHAIETLATAASLNILVRRNYILVDSDWKKNVF